LAAPEPGDDLIARDESLDRLAAVDLVKAQLVNFRHFAGLTSEQAAVALNIYPATAKRYWAYSRAWLFQAITGEAMEKTSRRLSGSGLQLRFVDRREWPGDLP